MSKINHFFRRLTDGLNTETVTLLPSPNSVMKKFKLSQKDLEKILGWRQDIVNILDRLDNRFLVFTGPCSVHGYEAFLEYSRRLKPIADKFSKKMLIVERCCFEKPRTYDEWEGALSDVCGNGTGSLEEGIDFCRRLLVEILKIGLPVASELLDPNTEPFFSDLLTFGWVGGRTTDATIIKRMISAMSCPVGVKNPISGDILSAVRTMVYAQSGKTFPGPNPNGRLAAMKAVGNKNTCLILRGANIPDCFKRDREQVLKILADGQVDEVIQEKCRTLFGGDIRPNYSPEEIAAAVEAMKKEGLPSKGIVIDCSHGNCKKQYEIQEEVCKSVVKQKVAGNQAIRGVMLESYLKPGKQEHKGKRFSDLDPRLSVTDACLGIEQTEELLSWMYKQLS